MEAENYFSKVCPQEKQKVQKYYFTAENGIILALDGLGRPEEAILRARTQLSAENLDEIEQALKNIQELRSCHESDHE